MLDILLATSLQTNSCDTNALLQRHGEGFLLNDLPRQAVLRAQVQADSQTGAKLGPRRLRQHRKLVMRPLRYTQRLISDT